MQELYDQLVGGEITKEVYEAKLTERETALKEEATNATKTEYEERIKTLGEELAAEKDKDKNLAALRKQAEAGGKVPEAVQKELDDMKVQFSNLTNQQKLDKVADNLSDGNSEMKDKIMHFYNGFKGESGSDEEIQSRMKNAAILAGAELAPNKPSGGGGQFSGAGGGVPKMSPSVGKVSAEGREAAKILLKTAGFSEKEVTEAGVL